MASVEEQIKEIEDEIEKTPRNKGTEHHIGKLKAKLAKLIDEGEKRTSKKSGISLYGYSAKKTGHATCVLVGYPSVGKSTILNKLTNAKSKIGAYDFTTLEVIPGMMDYKSANIQILDIPGIVDEAASGKGRGREILSVARTADVVLIIIDIKRVARIPYIKEELYESGFRLNVERPDIDIIKKDRGGIVINSAVRQTKIDDILIKSILNEFSVANCEITIREVLTPERLIDALSRNRVYVPMFVVVNKIDGFEGNLKDVAKSVDEDLIFVSADKDLNMDELRAKIFSSLRFLRIYMKQPGKPADMKEPMILRGKYTVLDLARKIHKEMAKNFNYARIWGPSAKFDGQKVGPNHYISDLDVVELSFVK